MLSNTFKPSQASLKTSSVHDRVRIQKLRWIICKSESSDKNVPVTLSEKCPTCGVELSKIPNGCDKEGRIIGGLGAVPGFGWWPIKAYRPCPELTQAGLEYARKGQITNDILFGGGSLGSKGAQSLDEMKKTAARGIKIE